MVRNVNSPAYPAILQVYVYRIITKIKKKLYQSTLFPTEQDVNIHFETSVSCSRVCLFLAYDVPVSALNYLSTDVISHIKCKHNTSLPAGF